MRAAGTAVEPFRAERTEGELQDVVRSPGGGRSRVCGSAGRVLSCRVQITETFRGSSPVRIAVTGAVGFFVLGVLISVMGPTLPELRSRHGLDATGGALLLAAYSVGSAVGVGIAGWFRHRAPIQRLLSLGALGLAIGSAGVPAAPNAFAAGASLFVAGVGLGVVTCCSTCSWPGRSAVAAARC
jgi:MFS family permease